MRGILPAHRVVSAGREFPAKAAGTSLGALFEDQNSSRAAYHFQQSGQFRASQSLNQVLYCAYCMAKKGTFSSFEAMAKAMADKKDEEKKNETSVDLTKDADVNKTDPRITAE